MNLRDWLLPDEVQSAVVAGAEMLRVVTKTSHFWIKQTVAALIPLAGGAGLGYWLSDGPVTPTQIVAMKDIMMGIMTFISVLAGFMVTLMLFTGRSGGAKLLSVDQAPLYVEKITYLLFSQAVTLAVHIVCILGCFSLADSTEPWRRRTAGAMVIRSNHWVAASLDVQDIATTFSDLRSTSF